MIGFSFIKDTEKFSLTVKKIRISGLIKYLVID